MQSCSRDGTVMELVINYQTTVPSNTALISRNMSYKWALMTDEILLNCGLVAMILPLKQADIPTIENLFRNESAISVTLTKLKMNSISLWHAHFITMKEIYKACLQSLSSMSLSPTRETYPTLMQCANGDLEFSRATCQFVNACFAKRKSSL